MKYGLIRSIVGMLVLSLAAALLIACQPIQAETANVQTSAESEKDEFVEVVLALEQAYQDEDLQRVLDFYADDAVSHAPGYPSDIGKDSIQVAYQGFFDVYEVQRDFELTDVEVGKDFATRTFEWTQISTPKDGSDPITEIGRCILGWKKVDGDWKVAWEIWNTYEGAVQ